ncbi:MAG: hypothetical protein AAGF67_03810 [Verrucomicrobiota bacterium]
MTQDAVDVLKKQVAAAIAAIPDVRHEQGYPFYPPAFGDLTRFISDSPFRRNDYLTELKPDWKERVFELSGGEVRSALTFLCRVDRQCPGGLLALLESGAAMDLVSRAEQLLLESGDKKSGAI